MKTSFFIDGFNLYHSLADNKKDTSLKQYRWFDIKKYCKIFLKPSDTLENIYFFTAFAEWDLGKKQRHEIYIKALESTGIKIVMGKFQNIRKYCRNCKKTYRTFEEKQTDVSIASHLLKLAFQNEFDRFFLLSGDNDLTPATIL